MRALLCGLMAYARFAVQGAGMGYDHGTANTHFVLGGKVNGGLFGQAPSLTLLEGSNLVHSVDFRSLYASVIEKWWGADAKIALNGKFATLDLLKI